MFLSPQDIVELTRKKQKAAQMRALRGMGIEHRIRPDGSIAVLKEHIDKEFGGVQPTANAVRQQPWGEVL